MASPPSRTTQSSSIQVPDRKAKLRSLIRKGYTSGEIARKLAPDNPRRQKQVRQEVRATIASDEEYLAMKALSFKGALNEELDGVAEAIGRRARRGRMDAAKLLLEATGIHNPRVKHEHSGDIQITLAIPRPPVQTDEIGPGKDLVDLPDADVVEE